MGQSRTLKVNKHTRLGEGTEAELHDRLGGILIWSSGPGNKGC